MMTVKAYGGTSAYIFVSYAHKDRETVLPVIAYLQRRGYNVWYDEGIIPGAEWEEVLGARIKGCACFLCFLSFRSVTSPECAKEIRRACELKKPMVNVFMEPIDLTQGAVAEILDVQGIEWFRLENDSDFYIKLLEHDLFEPCRDTEEFQVIDGGLVRYNGDATAVVIPDSVTKIGYNAFEGAGRLQWLSIPEGVDRIGKFAFSGTPALLSFQVAERSGFFRAIDGVLYNKSGNYLLRYPSARPDERYEVPDGVKFVSIVAFSQAEVLASVVLPDSVTYIGDRAFEACRNLVDIRIGGSVEKIRPYTFSRCSSLVSCKLPSALRVLEDGGFSGCINLETIEFPESLRTLGAMAFAHCSAMRSVVLPVGVREVPEYCFHECTSLASADLGNVRVVAGYAFKNCESLTQVVFGGALERIGRAAFSGCSSLQGIRIPGSVKTIDDYALDRCRKLHIVVIEEGVREIGEGAFKDDISLERVVLPPSAIHVHPRAFPEWTEVVRL